MNTKIEDGCDISWWQGIVNFVKMVLSGIKFVIIRAGSCNKNTGECYWDYNVATNAAGAEEVELPKGFYWYYREFGIHHAQKQARFFWNGVSEWSIEKFLACDAELHDILLGNVCAFMEELQRVSGLPDKQLAIYSRALLWNALKGDHSRFARFLCWVARYFSGDHPWNDNPQNMRMQPWADPDFWQFSADGNGLGAVHGVESRDLDLNLAFIAGEPNGEEPEEPAHVLIIPTGAVEIEVQEQV